MTNIQMLLALGAMILLTILLLNVNKNSLAVEDVMYDSNFGITATSIASSVIEDASKKRFDQVFYIDSLTVYDPSHFTPAADLGVDSGEVITDPKTFNDFDDYDNYTYVDSTMPSAIFNVLCKVNYVNDTALDDSVNTQTYHKKITIKVWSKSMSDTMVMSSIYSYWNFLP
jgi:hypothetical protein